MKNPKQIQIIPSELNCATNNSSNAVKANIEEKKKKERTFGKHFE